MFEDSRFTIYPFEEVPVGRDKDIYLVSDEWLMPYAHMMDQFLNGQSAWEPVGFISHIAVESISADSMEISWFANISTRYHEITITLPRSEFVLCVECWTCSERPRIFVKAEWLDHLHLRNYSVFALVDAIGVKNALASSQLTSPQLLDLRHRIDEIASNHSDVSFITFGDSLLLKANWTVGMFGSDVTYTYAPEGFVAIIKEIAEVYRKVAGLQVYGIITQGSNEHYGSALLHISETGNHVCLNSLGIPFERLLAIDVAARGAIAAHSHPPAELYLEEEFYKSLRMRDGFKKDLRNGKPFKSKMTQKAGKYFPTSIAEILGNLDVEDRT